MIRVFIGLGSNLAEPVAQIKKAIEELVKLDKVKVVQSSPLYMSKPMGPQDQPDFVNAVIELETSLSAEKLLDECQAIENKQGRVRKQHWGPRTLDLDILLYGDEVINTERLTVPHRGIAQRNFVLYPLNDIVGSDFNILDVGVVADLLNSCSMDGLQRINE